MSANVNVDGRLVSPGAPGQEDVLREIFLPWDGEDKRYVLPLPMAEVGRTCCFFTFGDYGGNGNAPVVIYDEAAGRGYDCHDLRGAVIYNWQPPWNGDHGGHMLYGALERMGAEDESGRVVLESVPALTYSTMIDGTSSFTSFDGVIYEGMYFVKHDANLKNDPYPWQNKTLIALGRDNVYGQLVISYGGLFWRAHSYDGELGKFAWTGWEKVTGVGV